MFKLLQISAKLSLGYHPETNGQSERTNQTLEQYLCCFINYQQDDWVDFLHLAEFACNNSIHSSTRYSPFFANTGCHPRWTMNAHPEVPVGVKAVNAEVQATFVMKKNLRMRRSKIRTEREREIGTKNRYIPIATVTNDNRP